MWEFNIEGIRLERGESSVAFVLGDSALFFGTGFKILKNQVSGQFLPCVRSEYNGKVKLTYFTNRHPSLREYAKSANERGCRSVLVNLVTATAEACDNGFLSLRSVALSSDTVFVDVGLGKVGLVYLPVSISVSGQTDLQARKSLYSLCVDTLGKRSASGTKFDGLLETHEYEAGDLGYLVACLRGEREIPVPLRRAVPDPLVGRGGSSARLSRPVRGARVTYNLLPVGLRGAIAFHISKPRTIMGKHVDKADCVITTSPAVSRTHCILLLSSDGTLIVSDLGSVNGTYVDGRRVPKGEKVTLAEGSRLRLADVEFLVQKAG